MASDMNKHERKGFIAPFCFIFFSLLPVFVISFIISLPRVIDAADNASITDLSNLFLSIAWIMLSIGSWFFIVRASHVHGDGNRIVEDVDSVNAQAFTFFLTVVIPMISLSGNGGLEGTLSFWLSVVLLIALMLRTDMWVMNPILVAIGFNIYKVRYQNADARVIVITRNAISDGSLIFPVRIKAGFVFDGRR